MSNLNEDLVPHDDRELLELYSRHSILLQFRIIESAIITGHRRSCRKVMFSLVLPVHRGVGIPGPRSLLGVGMFRGGGYVQRGYPHPATDTYGRQAGTTHPTGMISCSLNRSVSALFS